MGRRALRNPDAQLDLSRHLRTLTELELPFSSAAHFGRNAPLEVEIGSGKGLFLKKAASSEPQHDYVGIEMARKYAVSAAAGLARLQLPNALMIHGDGLRFFREGLSSASVVAVHVYFPDPWWKKRHRKRRVMNGPILHDIERVLVGGGRLHFWTDVEEYFQTTLELICTTTSLAGPFEVAPQPAEHDLDYRTHFERRMRLHDEPVYRAEFARPASAISAQA